MSLKHEQRALQKAIRGRRLQEARMGMEMAVRMEMAEDGRLWALRRRARPDLAAKEHPPQAAVRKRRTCPGRPPLIRAIHLKRAEMTIMQMRRMMMKCRAR